MLPISKAQAIQRAGRAGRDVRVAAASGLCSCALRLLECASGSTLSKFSSTCPTFRCPKSSGASLFLILWHSLTGARRSNLASVILQMRVQGIDDVIGFDYMDPPPLSARMTNLFAVSFFSSFGSELTFMQSSAACSYCCIWVR